MLFCLNNMKGFSHKYNIDKQRTCMDHYMIVRQDENYIGKVVHLKFKDEYSQIIRTRLNINKSKFPEFTGTNSYDNWYFKIVRYDMDFPNTVILVDKENRVLVTTTEIISKLFVHPGYEFSSLSEFDSFIFEELRVPEIDWNEFNHKYPREYVHNFPIQDMDYYGKPVYIEYYNDIFNLKVKSQLKEIDLSDRNVDIEKIRERLLEVNPDLDVFDNSYLIRYPSYYESHLKDILDVPLRVVHKGYIIRVDKNANEPYIVVLQLNANGTYRFVTDREATFYFDDKFEAINLEDLQLWLK